MKKLTVLTNNLKKKILALLDKKNLMKTNEPTPILSENIPNEENISNELNHESFKLFIFQIIWNEESSTYPEFIPCNLIFRAIFFRTVRENIIRNVIFKLQLYRRVWRLNIIFMFHFYPKE